MKTYSFSSKQMILQVNNNLIDQIEQNKKIQLETAKKIAQNLDLYDSPQIGTESISDKKVQKRFNKISEIFNDKIKKNWIL